MNDLPMNEDSPPCPCPLCRGEGGDKYDDTPWDIGQLLEREQLPSARLASSRRTFSVGQESIYVIDWQPKDRERVMTAQTVLIRRKGPYEGGAPLRCGAAPRFERIQG